MNNAESGKEMLTICTIYWGNGHVIGEVLFQSFEMQLHCSKCRDNGSPLPVCGVGEAYSEERTHNKEEVVIVYNTAKLGSSSSVCLTLSRAQLYFKM